MQGTIQRPGGREVVAERLLDHEPAPAAVLLGQLRFAKLLDDSRIQFRGHGQIKKPLTPLLALVLAQPVLQGS